MEIISPQLRKKLERLSPKERQRLVGGLTKSRIRTIRLMELSKLEAQKAKQRRTFI